MNNPQIWGSPVSSDPETSAVKSVCPCDLLAGRPEAGGSSPHQVREQGPHGRGLSILLPGSFFSCLSVGPLAPGPPEPRFWLCPVLSFPRALAYNPHSHPLLCRGVLDTRACFLSMENLQGEVHQQS